MSVTIDPRRFFRWHCAVIAAIVLVHVPLGLLDVLGDHDRVLGVSRIFDLRREGNVPTFLSALALLAASGVALALAALDRRDAGRFGGTWTIVAAALLFAAVDEGAQIHELLTPPLRRILGGAGPLYFTWIVPYTIGVGVITGLAWPAVRGLGRAPGAWILAGVILSLAGAVGVEMLQGDLWTRQGPASGKSLVNLVLATCEEALELVGGAVLLRGLLAGLAHRLGGHTLHLSA